MNQQEYEDLIDTEAVKYTELDELQSNTSQVSFWQYVKKVIAFLAAFLETLFNAHKKEVDDLIDTTETGHIDWYIKMIKAFQYGDPLVIINNTPTYSVIDVTRQIVKGVAYEEVDMEPGFKLLFKVAKEVDGIYVPLEVDELAALIVYVGRRKIPGTWIEIISLPADQFRIDCQVTLDPLMFNIDGSLISNPDSFPFTEGLNVFFKDLGFGAVLYRSEIIEYVMGIPGIVNVFITDTAVHPIFSFFDRANLAAGYAVLDESSSTISYAFS